MSPNLKPKKTVQVKKLELKVYLLTNHGLDAVADKHRQKSMIGGRSCAVDNVGEFGSALQVNYGCERPLNEDINT